MEITIEKALLLGSKAQSEGRFQEADRYYTAVIKAEPNHPEANYRIGMLATEVDRAFDGLPFLRKAVEQNPQVSEYWVTYINVLVKLGKVAEAWSLLEQSKSVGLSGELFVELERVISGLHGIEAALTPPQTELQTLVNLYTQGKLADAVRGSERLLEHYPQCSILYNIHGAIRQGLGDIEGAVASFHKAIELDDTYAEALNNLGNAYQILGYFSKAIETYKDYLVIEPNSSDGYNNLGTALHKSGDFDGAIIAFDKAIALLPHNPVALYNKGNALRAIGKLTDALVSYNKSKDLGYRNPDLFMNLGMTHDDQGSAREAVMSFQESFKLRSSIHSNDYDLAPAVTSVFFELTNKCNFHCVFCPSDSQTREIGSMDVKLVKQLYDEAASKNLASVVNLHLMGEPTLHPKLIEILDYASSVNVKTDLVTNGSTLVEKIVPKLLNSLYGTLTASHMTPTEDTYHYRGKVRLSWDRYIGNIRLLVREYMRLVAEGSKVRSVINIRVMVSQNTAANVDILEDEAQAKSILEEWNEFVSDVEREFQLERYQRKCHTDKNILRGNQHATTSYELYPGINLVFWKAFTYANKRVSDDFTLEKRASASFCSHPFTDVGVLWNGDVTLCCLDHDGELTVGNIKDNSIETVITSEKANELRASMLGRGPLPEVCKTCQANTVSRD